MGHVSSGGGVNLGFASRADSVSNSPPCGRADVRLEEAPSIEAEMSLLYRRHELRPPGRARVDGQGGGGGRYLTDEILFYRVVGVLKREKDEFVEIEDRYWLDVVRVPASELPARRLRVVARLTADA